MVTLKHMQKLVKIENDAQIEIENGAH